MRSVGWASVCIFVFIAGAVAQAPVPAQQPLDLSLAKAVELATSSSGDPRVQIALDTEHISQAAYLQARAALLPDLEGTVAEQNQTVNPRALGLQFTAPGFTVPNEVGPFNTFDARLRLTQNILSLSALRHWQAAGRDRTAAASGIDTARQEVAAAVARAYVQALRADAALAVAQAGLTDAQALRDLAQHRGSVGEGTGLDTARARLSVARAQQQLLAAQTAQSRATLELLRLLNLTWDTTLHLTGHLDAPPLDPPAVDDAVKQALQNRADLKQQEGRVAGARFDASAATMEQMPSLVGYGDYGDLQGVQTHTVGAELRVPLFDGGRTRSDRIQAGAVLHEQQTRSRDLRKQIELEVREAVAALNTTAQAVQVADQAVTLAEDELTHARHRYEAGVTNSLEVVDAETELEKARDDRVAARFDYANARIELAQAQGTTPQLEF